MNIIRLIKNMFKIAKILSVDDTGDYQFMSVSTLGKTQKVMSLKPYGLMSNPPISAIVALWSQQGQESNGIGIADDPKNRPIKNLSPGEVAIGNYTTGSTLYFNSAGDCTLYSTNDNNLYSIGETTVTSVQNTIMTAPVIILNGSVDNLIMWSALNVQLQAFFTQFNNHYHVGSTSDKIPVVPLSLDITSARADSLKTSG